MNAIREGNYQPPVAHKPLNRFQWNLEYITCHQQGHAGSKTLHQQNPPVINWRCWLTQVDLYTYTRLMALCPGLPGWAGTTEARDSEWQWHQLGHMQVCTSLQTDNHASTPPLTFLQAGCPSCRLTMSMYWRQVDLYNGRKTVAVVVARIYNYVAGVTTHMQMHVVLWQCGWSQQTTDRSRFGFFSNLSTLIIGLR